MRVWFARVVAVASVVLAAVVGQGARAYQPAKSTASAQGQAPRMEPVRAYASSLSGKLPAASEWALPSPHFDHYPTSAELAAYINELNAQYPRLTELYELGVTWQGRPILGLRLASESGGNPDDRPGLYVDGQHHAREPISQQVALYLVQELLEGYGHDPLATYLLDNRVLYVVPSVNPDGNDLFLTTDVSQRRNANPGASDDDQDGLFDEDPANGAGFGAYSVTQYNFRSEWVALHPDDPFAAGWQSWLISTQDLGIEDARGTPVPQVDDDNDGRVNEDPVGGVDLNRNYDIHWEGGSGNPADLTYRGSQPFSEPETRAVRDFVQAHPNIRMAASLHSGDYVILHPWGFSGTEPLHDAVTFEHLARKGSQLTASFGEPGARHTWTARGLYVTPGSSMDWLYVQGIYAVCPEVYSGVSRARVERAEGTNSFRVYESEGLFFNPPPSEMTPVLQSWDRYLRYLLAAAPGPTFTRVEAAPGGLRVGVANEGGVAVQMDVSAAVDSGAPLTLPPASLRGEEHLWTIPLTPGEDHTVTLTAVAENAISTSPGETLSATVAINVSVDGAVTISQGSVRPFEFVASAFAGWDADPRAWDTSAYHLGDPLGVELFLPRVSLSP